MTSAELREYECALIVARQRMEQHPRERAEAIARHYVANFNAAKDLLDICENRKRYAPSSDDIDALIQQLAGDIARAHARELGIELEWNDPT